MVPVHISSASLDDLEKLRAIAMATFSETFAGTTSEENMSKYLEKRFSREQLCTELSDPEASFYLALCGEKAVAYLKLNFGEAQTELKDARAAEIERIYVLSDFQGKKVAQLLLDKALEVAAKKSLDYIWLGVWEENARAIRFYTKNGFATFGRHVFWMGDDAQTDLMMKRELA